MVKRYISLLALFLIAGCSAPKQTPSLQPTPPQPATGQANPQAPSEPPVATDQRASVELPPKGTAVSWPDLPPILRDADPLMATSPDGKWAVATTPAENGREALWILATARDRAWFVDDGLLPSRSANYYWTPANVLVFRHYYGDGVWETWYHADPAAGKVALYAPEALAGRNVREFRFSPDRTKFLAEADICDGCNKPSEKAVTTYLVDFASGAVQEVGVDVEATWEDGALKITPEEPHMGYSGPVLVKPDGGPQVRPLSLSIQVGATDYAEWRAYRIGAGPGEAPFTVIPAVDRVTSYNSWDLWWPDPPAEPFRLELWAEVRPTVSDPPAALQRSKYAAEIRREGGKRWAVVFSREVTVEDTPAKQTVLLQSAHMWDLQNGWAEGFGGRILRTADGGATWHDVSPAGFARCEGRYAPRQAVSFGAGTAVDAQTCGRTGPDGHWTADNGRVSIFRTGDTGVTWKETALDTGYQFANPAAIQFLDANNGWALVQPFVTWPAVTEAGALYRTADGGQTWTKAADTADGLPAAREVTFVDPRRGWAVGSMGASLWSTADGGATWQPVAQNGPTAGVSAPIFITAAEGYYLNGRELQWTADGGRTWSKRSDLPKGWGRPAFLTPAVGYLWEYELRTVYWTHDGGRTWEPRVWEINPTGIGSVQFVKERVGYAVQGQLWRTDDGGTNWTAIYPQLVR